MIAFLNAMRSHKSFQATWQAQLPADNAMPQEMSITPVRMASLLIPPLTVMAVILYLSAQPSAGD